MHHNYSTFCLHLFLLISAAKHERVSYSLEVTRGPTTGTIMMEIYDEAAASRVTQHRKGKEILFLQISSDRHSKMNSNKARGINRE